MTSFIIANAFNFTIDPNKSWIFAKGLANDFGQKYYFILFFWLKKARKYCFVMFYTTWSFENPVS